MSAPSAWLSLLVPDERGQRAIQETIADWRADAGEAATSLARVKAHAVGLLSLAWLAACLLADQMTWLPMWRTLLVTVIVTTVLTLALATSTTWLIWGWDGATHGAYLLALAATLSLNLFAIVSALGPVSNDDRATPAAATVCLLFLFSWVMATWLSPALVALLSRQLAVTLPVGQTGSYHVPFLFAARVASLSYASTYYLLGVTLRRRLSRFGWRARQLWVLGAVFAISALGGGARAIAIGSPTMSPAARMNWFEIVMFGQLAIAWSAIIWLSRKATPVE